MLQTTKWDGKRISKPGMYGGIPLAVYHSQKICDGPSVSSSGLRRALEVNGGSPADFYNEWSGNPNAEEGDDTKEHFVMGRAVHHLVLGVPHFAREFAIRPDKIESRASGRMIEWGRAYRDHEDWIRRHAPGKTLLSNTQVEHIKGMAQAIGKTVLARSEIGETVMGSLLKGKIERSLIWKDKETGLWIKSRPDAIPTESGYFADLKTTTSVQWIDLMRSMTDFAYHQQAALVREACSVLGFPFVAFVFVFVQKKRPYSVRRVMVKPQDLDLGHKQNCDARLLIARCLKDKTWPGPGSGDDEHGYINLFDGYRERAEKLINGGRQ